LYRHEAAGETVEQHVATDDAADDGWHGSWWRRWCTHGLHVWRHPTPPPSSACDPRVWRWRITRQVGLRCDDASRAPCIEWRYHSATSVGVLTDIPSSRMTMDCCIVRAVHRCRMQPILSMLKHICVEKCVHVTIPALQYSKYTSSSTGFSGYTLQTRKAHFKTEMLAMAQQQC
jgi:hypothetical protein